MVAIVDVTPQMTIRDFAQVGNLVDVLDESQLRTIGSDCLQQHKRDEDSRSEWLKTHDKAMDMALQKSKDKSYPFNKASNVIYPLITTAAVQFAARAYPAIIPSREVTKGKVIGDDSGVYEVNFETGEQQIVEPSGMKAGKAARIARFMNFQLLEVETNWESDTDKLLHYLPIAGTAFRKRYWDGRPGSKFITAKHLVVDMAAKSLDTAVQVGELVNLYYHEIRERVNRGTYNADAVEKDLTGDEEHQIELVEAHCRVDLDDDGYPEPYIVTFNLDTGTVYRMVANYGEVEIEGERVIAIKPNEYFIKYPFIPNPDGGFYDIGFGWLLGPINSAINTAINQMNDAAHWQNAPSGFISKRLRLKSGDNRFQPGEYKPVDNTGDALRNEIVTLDFAGPSAVTMQLLSVMINAGQDISSVKDIMLGDMDKNIAPTTALTLVEQGAKQFTAIYKRIHRALKKEMALLLKQNRENIQEIMPLYLEVLDDDETSPEDFNSATEIVPVTDPDMVSDGTAMAKAQFIEQLAMQGRVDPQESLRRTLEAANVEDPASLEPKQGEPDPEIMLKMAKLENDRIRIQNDTVRAQADVVVMYTEAVRNLADAEAKEEGQQIARYKAEVDAIRSVLDGLSRMAGESGNPAGAGNVPQSGSSQGIGNSGILPVQPDIG